MTGRATSSRVRERRFMYGDRKWHTFEERASELLAYEKGWDGHGASPISPAAIDRARQFLGVVAPALEPMVGGTPRGGVDLYFEFESDHEAVIVHFRPDSGDDEVYVEMEFQDD